MKYIEVRTVEIETLYTIDIHIRGYDGDIKYNISNYLCIKLPSKMKYIYSIDKYMGIMFSSQEEVTRLYNYICSNRRSLLRKLSKAYNEYLSLRYNIAIGIDFPIHPTIELCKHTTTIYVNDGIYESNCEILSKQELI